MRRDEGSQSYVSARHSKKGRLLRIVGVGFGIALTIGGTVDCGILHTPGKVAAQLRSAWLILAVWVFGSVYALFTTLPVSELATMLRDRGALPRSRRVKPPTSLCSLTSQACRPKISAQ